LHQKKKGNAPLTKGHKIGDNNMAKTRRLGNFTETNEKVEFTFMGWDGTGYNGEGKTQKVWRIAGDETKYICKWMPGYHAYCILSINENDRAKQTNLPKAYFVGDFEREEMETITL
jgi:hypothetical protein